MKKNDGRKARNRLTRSAKRGSNNGATESASGHATAEGAGWSPPAPLKDEDLKPAALQSTLNELEQQTLAECEETIRKGWTNFLAVGEALLRIRDEKLYRDRYGTFEGYHRQEWQYQKSQVYRLMDAAKVVRILADSSESSPIGEVLEIRLPKSESQVRPLVRLLERGAAKVSAAWKNAVEEAGEGKVTARQVQKQVRAILPRSMNRKGPALNGANLRRIWDVFWRADFGAEGCPFYGDVW